MMRRLRANASHRRKAAVTLPDSGSARRLRVTAGACSVQGTRRQINEDRQYVSPDVDLFIVADGMGGHAAGEVASRFAVDVISHDLSQIATASGEREIEERVKASLERANCLILDTANQTPAYRGAGTTIVLALLLNHRLYVAGVGDSRAYLIRGSRIERLTVDDTWPDQLLHMGQISVDEAQRHYLRNRLLTALGMPEFQAAQEEIQVVEVYHGDRYLLASDGLTDTLTEDQLLRAVRESDDPQRATEILVQQAIEAGAGDDVTCVAAYVQCDIDHRDCPQRARSIWRRLRGMFDHRV